MAVDFTELRVWQIAHKLTIDIYLLTKNFPKEEIYGLISQLRRAAVSVEANIAESHGRFHSADIVRFLLDSRGSIYEVQSLLMISKDVGYCTSRSTDDLLKQYSDLAKQINSLIRYKRNN